MNSVLDIQDAEQRAASFREQSAFSFINGELVPAVATLEVVDPATGEPIAAIARGSASEIESAVDAAVAAFTADRWVSDTARRASLLWQLADLIRDNALELAVLETLDSGKLLQDTLRVDVPAAEAYVRYWSGAATRIGGDTLPMTIPGDWHAFTLREPVGIVGAITPWNFPLIVAVWKIAPAIACGCTVVLKPSEEASLTSLRLATLIAEAGFPPGTVNIVTGTGPEAGGPLVRHPNVQKVTFTGSTAVGQMVIREGAATMKRLSLELGGKSAAIVFDDGQVERAVRVLTKLGSFFHQGQICSAASRWIVHESVYEQTVELARDAAEQLRLGPGMNAESEMGPVISAKQLERVLGFVRVGAEQDGARLVAGGGRASDLAPGFFVQPTVFADVRPEMTIAQEEIFGPVVAITPFADEEEAIALANDSKYGLAGAVWTRDVARAHRVLKKLNAGTVWVNTYNVTDVTTPWGGRGMSGIGREHGTAAIEAYTELKTGIISLR